MNSYRYRSNTLWKLNHWSAHTSPRTRMLTSTGRFTPHWKGNYLVWNYIRFLFNQSREIIVVWFLSAPHFTPYWEKEPIYHQQHIQWVCDSNIRTIEWDHLMPIKGNNCGLIPMTIAPACISAGIALDWVTGNHLSLMQKTLSFRRLLSLIMQLDYCLSVATKHWKEYLSEKYAVIL